jgi:outer membrane protein assembly factor BamB
MSGPPTRRRFLAAAGASLLTAGCASTRISGSRIAGLASSRQTLLCCTAGNEVLALDAATGGVAWTRPIPGAYASTPIIGGGLCYVMGADNTLLALDTATGATRWRYPGGAVPVGLVLNSPAGLFCFGAASRLRALDPATGEERWTRQTRNSSYPALASVGDSVAVGQDGVAGAGWCTAFDNRSGDVRYDADHGFIASAEAPVYAADGRYLLADASSTFLLDPASWQESAGPASESALGAAPGTVYTSSPAGQVQAIDTGTGQLRWTLPQPPFTYMFLALASGSRVLVVSTFRVTAADATTGRALWTRQFNQDQTGVGYAIADDQTLFLLVSDPDYNAPVNGRVIALDAATGAQRWVSPVAGQPFWPILAGGTLFFSTGEQDIYALETAGGGTRWVRSAPGGQPPNLALA